jgi:hypothetical protein
MAAGREVAEEAIDAVADVAEKVSQESAQVAEVTRRLNATHAGFLVGGLGIGLAAGFAGGYFLQKKVLQLKYEKIADKEIASMREHYERKAKALDLTAEKKTLDEVSEELKYRTEGEGKVPYYKVGSELDKPRTEIAPDQPLQNVFETPQEPLVLDPNWDYAVENRARRPDIPYTIHKDEYDKGQEGYDKVVLTYFEGDDVLCNQKDEVIEEQDEMIGMANLSRFGQGSGDPNIVYVRNEEKKMDIEIVHTDRKYAVEVHGFADDEIRHSSMKRRSPRRSDDDNSS